jgi:hypothetical protein
MIYKQTLASDAAFGVRVATCQKRCPDMINVAQPPGPLQHQMLTKLTKTNELLTTNYE